MGTSLASFKNSRQYGRKATTSATTDTVTVNGNGEATPTEILPADGNRTYATLVNMSETDAILYGYQPDGGAAPTIAELQSDGFELPPGGSIDLESPEAVHAVSDTTDPVTVKIDVGTG